jgi:hypothetical protein
MNTGQTFSAREDRRKASTARLIRSAAALLLILASVLPAVPALGMDGLAQKPTVQRPPTSFPLPPIPFLETTPWLEWMPIKNGLKIDTLQLPRTPFDGRFVGDGRSPHRTVALPVS